MLLDELLTRIRSRKRFYIILSFILALVCFATFYVFFMRSPSEQTEDATAADPNVKRKTSRESAKRPQVKSDPLPTREDLMAGRDQRWQLETVKGRIRNLYGGRLKVSDLDESRIASTAQAMLPTFGLSEGSLADRAEPAGGRRSEGVQVYFIQHLHQARPVFGSRMRVVVDYPKSEILSFNLNEMKEVHGDLPNAVLKPESIRQRLKQFSSEAKLLDEKGLFVFPDRAGRARLVYQARSTGEGTYRPDTEIWLLDASTGKIIHRNSIVISDEYKSLK
jgi:hypothetical protein